MIFLCIGPYVGTSSLSFPESSVGLNHLFNENRFPRSRSISCNIGCVFLSQHGMTCLAQVFSSVSKLLRFLLLGGFAFCCLAAFMGAAP